MTGFDALVSSIVTYYFALIFHEPTPNIQFSIPWLGLILNTITQILGVVAVIYGYKHVEVQLVSIITPIEVVFAALFGFIIFHEILPPLSIIGGLCIFIAALLPHFKFKL